MYNWVVLLPNLPYIYGGHVNQLYKPARKCVYK